jgi:ribosome-associated protein
MNLIISASLEIPLNEIEISAVRAHGPGGQHVNKSATAVHLRFDINNSSLPEFYKKKLLSFHDKRISKDGVIIIKSQDYRSQYQNKEEALTRLKELILRAVKKRKKRKPTRPTAASQKKRVEKKIKRGQLKRLRDRVKDIE